MKILRQSIFSERQGQVSRSTEKFEDDYLNYLDTLTPEDNEKRGNPQGNIKRLHEYDKNDSQRARAGHIFNNTVRSASIGGGAGAIIGGTVGALTSSKGLRRNGAILGTLMTSAGGALLGEKIGKSRGTRKADKLRLGEDYVDRDFRDRITKIRSTRGEDPRGGDISFWGDRKKTTMMDYMSSPD